MNEWTNYEIYSLSLKLIETNDEIRFVCMKLRTKMADLVSEMENLIKETLLTFAEGREEQVIHKSCARVVTY